MKEFNKVIGYESIKKELYRIIDMMVNPRYYKDLGVKTTRGLLIEGKPGVGKTLMANCFIKASKRNSYIIRKDSSNGKFVDYIKNTFEKAKKCAPSIVFLDDLDKFANEDEDHVNAEEFVTIQSCIDDCKNDEVFVLATANDTGNLPRSLLRAGRFDKRIEVNAPNKKDAEKIIAYYLKDKKISKKVNIKSITRLLDGGTCAELETVINEAGIFSGYEHQKEIVMADIVKAFLRVAYDAPEEIEDIKDPRYEKAAVHEAGHALVGQLLEPGSVNLATIRRHDGDVGGFVSLTNCDDYFCDIKHMENRIITLLAGKAATEIIYNTIDIGASEDLSRAFRIVNRFVKQYASDGFKYFEVIYHGSSGSEKFQENAEDVVSRKVLGYYNQAKDIIKFNQDKLIKLKEALLKKDTIIFDEIESLINA